MAEVLTPDPRTPPPPAIAARANYQEWVEALIYLQAHLSRALCIEITDELPDFEPWKGSK